MPVPIALKESSRIILPLQLQKLLKLRIAGFHLPVQILDQLRPLDSSFHVNQSALAIEAQYVVEAAGIHQQRAIGKLLATHGVPATSNRECFACLPRSANDAAAFID